MSKSSSSNAIMVGVVVAVLIVGAFALGMSGVFEPDTPAEKLGKSVESAAGEVKEGLEKVGEGVKEATGN